MATITTVLIEDLNDFVQEAPGTVYLVGDMGGYSLINGEISRSSLVPGTMMIETEHGVVHLEYTYPQVVAVLDNDELIEIVKRV